MLKEHETQGSFEFVFIEQLVPKDHLLRKIDQAINFEFIREKTRGLYCPDNGRPAVDPVVLFKLLFIGYLYGIRSERQLIREVDVNVAYRWFLGFKLLESVPHASTFSQNRRRRFNGSPIYQEIFDEIVLQAARLGLVEGKILYTDSTHLKANANKNKFIEETVRQSGCRYIEELDRAIDQDREDHDKPPLPPITREPDTKTVKKSTSDPDSGYMIREGKPKGFFYLDHRTVDGKCNIITDAYTTPANIHDSVPYLERLDRQKERFGFDVEAVGLDAGYFTPHICKGLEERDIFGVIGYRRPNKGQGLFSKRKFAYVPEMDCYVCPMGQMMAYRTTNRIGYKEYASDPKICKTCPELHRCTRSANRQKIVSRHVWEESKERIDANRLTERGKKIYKRRKETVERSFADAKELHGHRYVRLRGLSKANEQNLLCAACQNMKKIALSQFGKGFSGFKSTLKLFFDSLSNLNLFIYSLCAQ